MKVETNAGFSDLVRTEGDRTEVLVSDTAAPNVLWIGEKRFDRSDVRELIGHLQAWLKTGRLGGGE